MYHWAPTVSGYAWIVIFFIFTISFNLLNVRRVGVIEYTFTAIKVTTLVGLCILGLVILSGGVDEQPLLGLDSIYNPVPCAQNNITMGPCLSEPGFNCIDFENDADSRLERVCVPWCIWIARSQSTSIWLLILLRDRSFRVHGDRNPCHYSVGNRVSSIYVAESCPTSFAPYRTLLPRSRFHPRAYGLRQRSTLDITNISD